jgi:hypothetical protein
MEGVQEARALALPLIGRSAEIARIGLAVERAADRRGSMLLLAGPAGIGKSRLVREVLTVAEVRGFVTLSSSARVLGQILAYAPVLEALGPHLMALPPGRRVGLLDGLPDLGRLLMGLHLPPPAPLGDPALDDLHWADTATVELLHYLARGVGDRRMLLVGTYRTDEAEAESALRALVRDVRRAGLAEELPLAGLPAGGVQSLAQAMLGGDPPPALVRLLTVRAAGSPLVVTALIGELLAGGGLFRSGGAWALGPGALDTVPAAVRDLVLGYLQRLAPQERGLLELVAVAGDAAMPPVLADVMGADEERVLAWLRRLRDLGLVAEVTESWGLREPGLTPDGARTHRDVVYQAAHPAYAEVAYGELPEATRRRRHAAMVVALERRWPYDIELLAPHYRGGGSLLDRQRTLDVLVAAAQRALAVHAGEEAARDPEAALAHVAGLGQAARLPGCWSGWPRRGRRSGIPRPRPRPGTRPSTPTDGQETLPVSHARAAGSPSPSGIEAHSSAPRRCCPRGSRRARRACRTRS